MNATQKLLNEVTLYGGIPMRRGDIYQHAKAAMGEHADTPFGAWYFACAGKTVDLEPMSLEDFKALEA